MNFNEIGIPTIKLFAIATLVTVLLFLTNSVTEAQIAENQRQADIVSRKEVLPEADDFEEATVDIDGVTYTYYVATNGAGYVFSGSNKGYGGDVVSMTGITSDGQIAGVKVTEQSETAGLGAKWAGTDAAGQEKRDQFKGDIRTVDARGFDAKAELAGGDLNETIYGGADKNSLWGGNGGDDLLVGGDGQNLFFYTNGNGNDTISGTNSGDVVYLSQVTMENIAGTSVENNVATINFNDGGKLTVNDASNASYVIGDQTYYVNGGEFTSTKPE